MEDYIDQHSALCTFTSSDNLEIFVLMYNIDNNALYDYFQNNVNNSFSISYEVIEDSFITSIMLDYNTEDDPIIKDINEEYFQSFYSFYLSKEGNVILKKGRCFENTCFGVVIDSDLNNKLKALTGIVIDSFDLTLNENSKLY